MGADPGERRAELLAAAVAGELTGQEQRELDALVVADPTVAEELAELRDTTLMLRASGVTWPEVEPSPGLADRIADAAGSPARPSSAAGSTGPGPTGTGSPASVRGHRSWWPTRSLVGAAAAAALLVTGAVLGDLLGEGVEPAPTGPPGTLGAVEEITFTGAPAARIEASLVAHTWGTETILEVDGVTPGETYEVVLVSEEGAELSSGTFFGTEQTVTCRMNAAVLRPDVARVVIERPDGTVLATSSVPSVEG